MAVLRLIQLGEYSWGLRLRIRGVGFKECVLRIEDTPKSVPVGLPRGCAAPGLQPNCHSQRICSCGSRTEKL